MRGNGDPAAEHAYDQIHILIVLAYAFRIVFRHSLVVQRLKAGNALNLFQAGIAGQRLKLIGAGGIYRERQSLSPLAQLQSDCRADRADMHAVIPAHGLRRVSGVDLIDAAVYRLRLTAAGDESIQLIHRDVVLFHIAQNRLLAELLLVKNRGAGGELMQVVGNGVFINAGIVLIIGDLCGGRSKVDGKDLFHAVSLLTGSAEWPTGWNSTLRPHRPCGCS